MNIPPIGFIGTGNMGSALARAVRRALPEAELFCSAARKRPRPWPKSWEAAP